MFFCIVKLIKGPFGGQHLESLVYQALLRVPKRTNHSLCMGNWALRNQRPLWPKKSARFGPVPPRETPVKPGTLWLGRNRGML